MDWRRIARQNARDLFAYRFDYIADSQQRPRLAFLKGFDDTHRHRHAQVSADERFFELIPVNRFARELLGESFEKIHRILEEWSRGVGGGKFNSLLHHSITPLPCAAAHARGDPNLFEYDRECRSQIGPNPCRRMPSLAQSPRWWGP